MLHQDAFCFSFVDDKVPQLGLSNQGLRVPYKRSDKKRGRPFDAKRFQLEVEKAHSRSVDARDDLRRWVKRQRLDTEFEQAGESAAELRDQLMRELAKEEAAMAELLQNQKDGN